jgi:hypothetical protein
MMQRSGGVAAAAGEQLLSTKIFYVSIGVHRT